MRVAYDRTADAAYVYLQDDVSLGPPSRKYLCDPGKVGGTIRLDFSASGKLIGIEVLDAARLLPTTMLEGADLLA
jgi:uncharacterized protein YuzE